MAKPRKPVSRQLVQFVDALWTSSSFRFEKFSRSKQRIEQLVYNFVVIREQATIVMKLYSVSGGYGSSISSAISSSGDAKMGQAKAGMLDRKVFKFEKVKLILFFCALSILVNFNSLNSQFVYDDS